MFKPSIFIYLQKKFADTFHKIHPNLCSQAKAQGPLVRSIEHTFIKSNGKNIIVYRAIHFQINLINFVRIFDHLQTSPSDSSFS